MQDTMQNLLQHSGPFRSSSHCKPSPDGQFVAVLDSESITVRSTMTLQTVHAVKLAPDLTRPIITFIWSPSSTNILICAADQIQVSSARTSSFHAVIRNPAAPVEGKLPLIRFGATDTEVLVCAPLGLKLSIFDLVSSRAVEITSLKFFQPSSASLGMSVRSQTGHLVVLTRVGGKDMVSIHHPLTRQVTRSWHPESVDAQGVQWTPDGRWIILWESPSQGRKVFVYSADAQHYRTLDASWLLRGSGEESESESGMQLGVKSCQLSGNSELCAIGDYSRVVIVLQTGTWRATMRLCHPLIINPSETLQVWQEQVENGVGGINTRTFTRAEKLVSPLAAVDGTTTAGDARLGCSSILFDASSTLLATRLDDSPYTIWIWDLAAGELRAALMFHSAVKFAWHATLREVLLITGQEDGKLVASYVWDPLSQGPKPLNVEQYLPPSDATSKLQISWLNHDSELLEILASDARHYVLLSLADKEHGNSRWKNANGENECDGSSTERDKAEHIASARPIVIAEDASKLDDTFSFKFT